MSTPIKVLLVDDHPLVRAGFQRLLIADDSIEIIGEADNGQSACEMYALHQPDVVIMDLNMPADSSAGEDSSINNLNSGLEAIRRIISKDAKAKVLVLTAMEKDPFPAHVVSAGAKGFLTKRCAPDELLEAVKAIHQGKEYITEEIRSRINGSSSDEASLSSLTKRELQIFSLLAEGRTVSTVADEMFLSPKTIHAHRTNIFRKLKISNNSELVHLAIRHNIVQA